MSRFETAFSIVLGHEGGYSNHPHDNGGPTNFGVTQETYDDWRRRSRQAPRDVRKITPEEVRKIYREGYWDLVRGDALPPGLDVAVFDYAINSGPGRAVRALQRRLGVKVDGIIGPKTLRAIERLYDHPDDLDRVIVGYIDARLAFLRRHEDWPHFKGGWTRRLYALEDVALEMAETGLSHPLPPEVAAVPAAPEEGYSVVRDIARDAAGLAKIAGAVAPILGSAALDGPLGWGLAAVAVVAAVFVGLHLLRKEPVV